MRTKQSTIALVLLLLVQLVVLGLQEDSPQRDSGPRRIMLQLTSPLSGMVSFLRRSSVAAGNRLRSGRELARANRELKAELSRLELQLMRLYGLEGDLERLQVAVAYERQAVEPVAVADIVYAETRGLLRSLVVRLNEGEAQHNQPVVVPAGIVGRVITASGRWARVQLITDREASVGAMIVRTRRQGLASGGPQGELELELVPLQEEVRPGDHVVTSGTDGIYPRGLPIGVVASVESGDEIFHRIELAPAVDPEQLPQVYLLPVRVWPAALEEAPADAPG